MSQWAPLRIGDTGELFDGPHATPKSKGKVSTDYIFLSISSLENGRLNLKESPSISEEDYLSWTRRVTPQAQDLVFSYETRLGEGALIPAGLTCCLGRRMALLRPNQKVIEPRFLLYLFLGPKFQQTIAERTIHGSTVNRIALNDFPDFPILLPDITEQRRIAGVLGALDDKIESNRRIAVKCDEVANILFHQAASVNRKLDEVSEVRMGVSPPGSSYNETGDGMPFFQGVRDFSLLHPVARVYTNQPKRLATSGDILFSVRAPVGRLNIADSPCCIGRGLAAITSNRSATCLFALRAAAAEWEKFSAEGTVFGAVNQKSLKSTLIPWPDPVTEEELEYQLSSLVTLASHSERESISLSKLRDALLPELMSGRMRVDEAGCLVSEALDEEVADV